MEEAEGQGDWQDQVEARVREAIARALEGTARQILANGVAHRAPARETPPVQAGRLDPPSADPAGPGPTREQMLQIIARHMAGGREHFARDGRLLETEEAVLRAMEEDGFVIVGQRVTLPAGYRSG